MNSRLQTKPTSILISVLGVISLAIVLVYLTFAQISALKTELRGFKRALAAMQDKFAQLERVAAELTSENGRLKSERETAKLKPANSQPALHLNADEIQLIRTYIRTPPSKPGTFATIRIGDELPSDRLMLLPPPLMEKLPKVAGRRFTIDRNSAIIISRRDENQVDLIIPPD